MPLLRLLSASVLASVCVLSASAQTLNLQQPPVPLPAISNTFTLQAAPTTQAAQQIFTITPLVIVPPSTVFLTQTSNPLQTMLIAKNQSPCYTMRSYGFTAKDLQSPNPRASTYSACSSAATVSRKEIQSPISIQATQVK